MDFSNKEAGDTHLSMNVNVLREKDTRVETAKAD